MVDLDAIYNQAEMISDNPGDYFNTAAFAVGFTAGFLANSVGKEFLDRTDRTEEWRSSERFLAGAYFSEIQYRSALTAYGDLDAPLSWADAGYASGGGVTYSLPHREELNEYVDAVIKLND